MKFKVGDRVALSTNRYTDTSNPRWGRIHGHIEGTVIKINYRGREFVCRNHSWEWQSPDLLVEWDNDRRAYYIESDLALLFRGRGFNKGYTLDKELEELFDI